MKDPAFANIVRRWATARGFVNDSEAATALGLDRSTYNKYKNAEMVPSFDRAALLLERMGGSMERAAPDYSPTDDVRRQIADELDTARRRARWPVLGEVDAATSLVAFVNEPTDSLPELAELYERSPLWKLSDGEPGFLRHRVPAAVQKHERYTAHFAIRPVAAWRLRLAEGPPGKIYAVARVSPTGEHYFGTWTRAHRAGFVVFQPAARIVGELDVDKQAWSDRDIEFTHIVLGVASYNTYDPQVEEPTKRARGAR